MRRYLLLILSLTLGASSFLLHATAAEQKPKFTLIFERGKEIPCSQNQENILIDFTSPYTVYKAPYHEIDFDFECRFSFSYDKKDFPEAKNAFQIQPQLFENNDWITWDKTNLEIPELRTTTFADLSKKSIKDNRQRLNATLYFPYIQPPRSDEYKATGLEYPRGAKSGVFCLDQNPGPIRIRYKLTKNDVSYFSNVVSLSYINYDKILYDGKNCYSTSQIAKPRTNGNTQNSQPATSTPKAGAAALKSCTTNEKLALTQIERQKYPLLRQQYDLQLELQKLQYDYGVAYLTGGQDRIQIQISQVESDLSSIGRSINNLSSQRQKILAKCNPNAQPSSTGVTNLKQCSQTEISRMQSFEKQYRALMRQADLYSSEIALLENRIGYLMLQGKMQEIAAANFAIEDQMQYRDQAYAQASYVEKQFETANSACLNSGISLKK
jgi:hypothetical protein